MSHSPDAEELVTELADELGETRATLRKLHRRHGALEAAVEDAVNDLRLVEGRLRAADGPLLTGEVLEVYEAVDAVADDLAAALEEDIEDRQAETTETPN